MSIAKKILTLASVASFAFVVYGTNGCAMPEEEAPAAEEEVSISEDELKTLNNCQAATLGLVLNGATTAALSVATVACAAGTIVFTIGTTTVGCAVPAGFTVASAAGTALAAANYQLQCSDGSTLNLPTRSQGNAQVYTITAGGKRHTNATTARTENKYQLKSNKGCITTCQCNNGRDNHASLPVGVGWGETCSTATQQAKAQCATSTGYHGRHCGCYKTTNLTHFGNGTQCE